MGLLITGIILWAWLVVFVLVMCSLHKLTTPPTPPPPVPRPYVLQPENCPYRPCDHIDCAQYGPSTCIHHRREEA